MTEEVKFYDPKAPNPAITTRANTIPNSAAPLTKPGEGLLGLFFTGLIWDGHQHQAYHTLPMKFEEMSGSQATISVITDFDVRSDSDEFWGLVGSLGDVHIALREKYDQRLKTLYVSKDVEQALLDYRQLVELGEVHRLDALRLLAEKEMMNFFNARYGGSRRIAHKVLGFGPVTLPAHIVYQLDDSPSELLIRPINNLSTVETSISKVYFAKFVWAALSRLFKLNSWGPLVWLYLNSVAPGLQKDGGNSSEGTQLLIARLLDRINMSPFGFDRLDVAGYLAAINMLYAGYSLSANILTPDNWITPYPIQVLHDFTPANATEHYNGQVGLLSKSGWQRAGGSISITACPFANINEFQGPGMYPITTASNPDHSNQVKIPTDFGGYNYKQDGSAIPTIPAEFDRMFGWFHDPQAEGVMLDIRSILPWRLVAAPPKDKLYSPIEFWKLYFYTVQDTGISMVSPEENVFHPLQWFSGFDSILPGNGFPMAIDASDLSISIGQPGTKGSAIYSWLQKRPFVLEKESLYRKKSR